MKKVFLFFCIFSLSGCFQTYEQWLETKGIEDPRPAAAAWCKQNPNECAETNASWQGRMSTMPQPAPTTIGTNKGVAFIEPSGSYFGNTQYVVMCNDGRDAKIAKLGSGDWAVNGATAFGTRNLTLNAAGFSLCS